MKQTKIWLIEVIEWKGAEMSLEDFFPEKTGEN